MGKGNHPEMNKAEELALLQEAFNRFTEATESLQLAYSRLEKEAQELKEELAVQKEYLELILESISEGVVALNTGGEIEHLNRAAATILEIPLTEARGRVLRDILGTPELREEVVLDGKILLLSSSPLVREQRNVGSVVVLRDVTRQKELEESAARQQRMAVMGEMATSIAHEIRNPLGSIELFAGLLKRELENTAEERWVESILSVTHHMETVISNLLLFARPFHPSKRPVSVRDLVEESLLMTTHAIQEKGIVLEKEYGDDCKILADAELMKQAMLNLVLNAVQSMKAGGTLTVGWQDDGNGVVISVGDTGEGMTKELLSRIFKPFYSTRQGGTGLGLAIVKRIVDEHGGRIEVKSVPREGTLFKIHLSRTGLDGEQG